MNQAQKKISLHRQVITFRIMAGVIPVILLVIAGIFTRLSADKIVAYKNIGQDIITKTQTLEEATSFNNFLSTRKIDLEKMSMAIPNESMLVGVIQDIEAIARTYDPAATVKFSSSTPAKIGQNLIIPMNVYLNLPLSKLPELFQDFSNLPYIIQIISSESKVNDNLATTNINLRLYVQEPFTQY